MVTDIYKKGNKSEPGNYRPVSLTCMYTVHNYGTHVFTHVATHLDIKDILTFGSMDLDLIFLVKPNLFLPFMIGHITLRIVAKLTLLCWISAKHLTASPMNA